MTRSILLVDDDSEILGMLTRFFQQKGWEVTRAAEAAAAVEVYNREPADVVLLDVNLPGSIGGSSPVMHAIGNARGRNAAGKISSMCGSVVWKAA